MSRSFARARLQQDYHAARELVRTFVPAGQRECVPPSAYLFSSRARRTCI